MAYPRHIRIVFRGAFAGTPEEWSFSTKWGKVYAGSPDADIENIDATGMKAALDGFLETSKFNSKVKCTGWRAYDIGEDGRMVGNPRIVEYATADQPTGTGANIFYPTQIALAVTTEGENRGAARFGRFYLPGPQLGLQADLLLSVTDATTYLTDSVNFLNAVQDSIDIPTSNLTARLINVSATGNGVEQQVRTVRVGRVYDTIRRRRTQLLEQYVENADPGLAGDTGP